MPTQKSNPTESGQPKANKTEPQAKSEQVKVQGDGIKKDVNKKLKGK